MSTKRRTFLIDRPVQVGLVTRMMLQWACLLVAVVIALPVVRVILLGDIAKPLPERLHHAVVEGGVLLIVFLLLLPYFMYDSFKLTNRFAGPMYRLQQTFRGQSRGKPFVPITFREGDYWHDAAEDFNAMMRRLEQQPAPPPTESEEEATELSLVESR